MAHRGPGLPKLSRKFYARCTLAVAEDLIGKRLVCVCGGERLAGRIVETEAYLAYPDQASHASRKNPKRAAIMFGPPGFVYVYMIYGMYFCVNFVTEVDGVAGAVLLRAVEPEDGIARMRRHRQRAMADRNLTSGPGKLCQAFGIDGSFNGEDACGSRLWVEPSDIRPVSIARGPRIGVDYAGEWAQKPWRFREAGNPFLSRP